MWYPSNQERAASLLVKSSWRLSGVRSRHAVRDASALLGSASLRRVASSALDPSLYIVIGSDTRWMLLLRTVWLDGSYGSAATGELRSRSCFRTTTLLQHWGASLGVALIRNGSRCGSPPQLGLLSRNGCALVYCASATPCVRAWSARSARTGGVPFPRMRFYCSLRSRCSRVDRLCTRRCALQKSRSSFPRAGR